MRANVKRSAGAMADVSTSVRLTSGRPQCLLTVIDEIQVVSTASHYLFENGDRYMFEDGDLRIWEASP